MDLSNNKTGMDKYQENLTNNGGNEEQALRETAAELEQMADNGELETLEDLLSASNFYRTDGGGAFSDN